MQELKIAFRRLFKKPGMTLVIVLTLAICLGAATALFSVVESVLLDPWPYEGFERIVTFRGNYPVTGETDRGVWSIPEFQDLGRQDQIFDQVMTGRGRDVNLTEGDTPERILAVAITSSIFPMLGVDPVVGRPFSAEEDQPGRGGVVVMSYDLWQRRFGGDPSITERDLDIEGERYRVVGVMPERFRWWNSDFWFPLMLDTTATDRGDRHLTVQARLREGVTIEQAEAELNALGERWAAEHGATNPEYEGMTFDLNYLVEGVLGDVKPALYVLLGFVLLLFVIGCVNVASLLMAQAIERRKETAIQVALGSSRAQILRRLLTESLLRALLGGALGLLLAFWAVKLIVGLIPSVYIPAETQIDVDAWALLFAFGASVLAAVLFGLIPALQSISVSQSELIKAGGSRSTGSVGARRLRAALVVAEVALATVVLVAAGLMIRTYVTLAQVDPGFNPDGVLTFRVSLPEERYGEPFQVEGFYSELTDRLGRMPGVQTVSGTTSLPLGGGTASAPITVEGRSAEDFGGVAVAGGRVVRSGYFETLEIPLHEGRDFASRDTLDSEPVVIVNQTMADRFWDGTSPVGQRFKVGEADSDRPYMRVIGLVGDVLDESVDGDVAPMFYLPHGQRTDRTRNLTMVVGTGVPPESIVGAVRSEVAEIDALLPIHDVSTLKTVWTESLGAKPLAATLLTVFAAIAVLLALVGLFAMMAYTVSRQSAEIGIRMAMGARQSDVVKAFLGQGLRLTVLGVAIGMVIGVLASRAVAGFVVGIGTLDPLTFVLAAVIFCLLGTLGTYIPSQRAARVHPAIALRQE